MKRRPSCKMIAALVMASMLMIAIGGCGKEDPATQSNEQVITIDPVGTDEPIVNVDTTEPAKESDNEAETTPETTAEAEPETGRKDGERFETVVILEGMEETVRYEHVINDTIGIEIDYDYESLVRQKDGDRESFVSIYDSIDAPENYLEIVRSEQDAETAAATVAAELSKKYEISQSDFMLDNAGKCIRIDASADVGGKTMPDQLQMVYIVPADHACIIATAHYAIEAAEGFGHRFAYIVHTMVVK